MLPSTRFNLVCLTVDEDTENVQSLSGQPSTEWTMTVNMVNVSNGIHQVTVDNARTQAGNASTNVSVPYVGNF